jgi:cytochrome c551/c552
MLLAGLAFSPAWSQEEGEEEEPYLPGLIAQYEQPGGQPATRLDPVIAGHWSARPDERLANDRLFTVTWQGLVLIPDDGSYQFHVHGNGNVQLQLAGKGLLPAGPLKGWRSSQPQTLSYGPTPLVVKFTATTWPAKISLFWSSDRFEREPIPARMLAHDREPKVETTFERGSVLARALRCEACHAAASDSMNEPIPAPALDQLAGNLQRPWLVNWLTDAHRPQQNEQENSSGIERRMPYLAMEPREAEILADWLLTPRADGAKSPESPPTKPTKPKSGEKKPPEPSATEGERLFLTLGCLACHQRGEHGESGLFGGGDLTNIAAKRPAEFFAKWLAQPESLNRDHRMPVFDLNPSQRQSLALFLGTGAGGERREAGVKAKPEEARQVARKHRCDQCHRLPEADSVARLTAPRKPAPLSRTSQWDQSCAHSAPAKQPTRPQFHLGKDDSEALEAYFSQRVLATKPQPATGHQLLVENNCLACHAREPAPVGIAPRRLADKLAPLAEQNEELASQIPAMTPPSLNSVGDKLTDDALAKAITRAGPPHRPYLHVQMPKFRLTDAQVKLVSQALIDEDRIPDYQPATNTNLDATTTLARQLAGRRLVGTDGFGCTSCHQVGSVPPLKAPLNARGPTLSMPQDRLRKAWFDRWVRNPARIVPRMEMPSVQLPVRGVLQDKLPDQLAAVWQVLSTPGFEPPLPEPVRTLRFYSIEKNDSKEPLVISDLIEHDGRTLERALLIGLPNRHNALFDLATHRLLSWSQGDLARQRTKGKNWYWEPAGSPLLTTGFAPSELSLEWKGKTYVATTAGQWLANPIHQSLSKQAFSLDYLLEFRPSKPESEQPEPQEDQQDLVPLLVRQTFTSFHATEGEGLRRYFELAGLPAGAKVRWQLLDSAQESLQKSAVKTTDDGIAVSLGQRALVQVTATSPTQFAWLEPGIAELQPKQLAAGGKFNFAAVYQSLLPHDEYHAPRPPPFPVEAPPVIIAPGFAGQRMTLPIDIMPTALAWRPNGDLVVASLKGQVVAFAKNSLTQSMPQGELLADGLAAPYGIKAGADYVDVAAKYALLRIGRAANDQVLEIQTLASGWGYTSDYHDWAVGLPQDAAGNYYLALPCFQDNRPAVAGKFKGSILKLVPRTPDFARPEYFAKEVLTHGHRFPMGMALNAQDELFVTDNQGNYNPFNELNFVRPGRHFGFVNKGAEKPTEVTSPAIDIPHPWTRSVNGICFLLTPKALQKEGKPPVFGPLEGHLVGCEYDTRRLIRMSLQRVGDDYQGCSYPLTVPTTPEESPLGPICCEISPAGELVVGNLRDSGWGAGNNIGEVIRIAVDPTKFGHGLAEMRATPTGFELDFFQPVDEKLATDPANYSLSSYRRESTPAYGGNDIDRRTEKVAKAELSEDRKRVLLTVNDLRAGHNYELRLKSLAADGSPFHPAEAHYTLRKVIK